MARNPAYVPTLVWDDDTLVWEDVAQGEMPEPTLMWDAAQPEPDNLGQIIVVKQDRGANIFVIGKGRAA